MILPSVTARRGVLESSSDAPADLGTVHLAGDLSAFTLFDTLQYLLVLRKSGTLEIASAEGPVASCRLTDGLVAEARCGHLTGREAILALVWWRTGSFRFHLQTGPAELGAGLRVEEMMIEAVRLEDELELRGSLVPALSARLALREGASPPQTEMRAANAEVFTLLTEHPGITRRELEAELPLAPVKVRLALAQLVQVGFLDSVVLAAPAVVASVAAKLDPASPIEPAAASTRWSRFQERFPGGLRILVAHSVQSAASEELPRAATELAEALGVPNLATAVSPVGPSFLRFRPPSGGLLSLTFLPMSRRNRYLFETFTGSVEAILLCGWCDGEEEAAAWTSLVPPTVDLEVLEHTRGLGLELVAALRRLSGGELP